MAPKYEQPVVKFLSSQGNRCYKSVSAKGLKSAAHSASGTTGHSSMMLYASYQYGLVWKLDNVNPGLIHHGLLIRVVLPK